MADGRLSNAHQGTAAGSIRGLDSYMMVNNQLPLGHVTRKSGAAQHSAAHQLKLLVL